MVDPPTGTTRNALATPQYAVQQTIPDPEPAAPQYWGWGQNPVAVSGNTLVIGSQGRKVNNGATWGAAYVYVRTGVAWTLQAKLFENGLFANDLFGAAVAISGDTIVVGGSTVPYVYRRTGVTWSSGTKLVAPAGYAFELPVKVEGDMIVTTAHMADFSDDGHTVIYGRSGNSWMQTALFSGSPTDRGSEYGNALAIDGDILAVCASEGARAAGPNGSVYIFSRNGTAWTQQKQIRAAPEQTNGNFGRNMTLNGGTLLVPFYVTNPDQTTTRVLYQYTSPSWSQTKITPSTPGSIGGVVASRGTTAIVSADAPGVIAWWYERSGTTWTEKQRIPSSGSSTGAEYLAVDGNTVVMGAYPSVLVYYRAVDNGTTCSTGADCHSGNCVDGVCCDTACTGTCQACTAAKRGAGADGTCGPIANGTDPDVECPKVTCPSQSLEKAHSCNGAGACKATSTTSCSPYLCDRTNACRTSCVDDSACTAGFYCDGAACVAKKAQGTSCARPGECASSFCTDAVCCDKACSDGCEACSATAGSPKPDGTCAFIPDGNDPADDCVGSTCLGTTLTQQVCDGLGMCRGATSSCAPFTCDSTNTVCANACTKDADCGNGSFCGPEKLCTARKDKGSPCTTKGECGSALTCVDGVCCDKPCEGQCQACDVDGAKGICTTVSGTPHGSRSTCTDDGAGCGGTCDGTDPVACTYPGAAQSCGSGCSNSMHSTCNGNGGCLAPVACPGFLSCESASKCRNACTSDADCDSKYACSPNRTCEPRASQCSQDRTQSVDTTGKKTDCTPIKCEIASGLCGKLCKTESDCVDGTTCDSSGQCSESGGDGSGGCNASNGQGGAGTALFFIALAALRRRRKHRASFRADAAAWATPANGRARQNQ